MIYDESKATKPICQTSTDKEQILETSEQQKIKKSKGFLKELVASNKSLSKKQCLLRLKSKKEEANSVCWVACTIFKVLLFSILGWNPLF